MFHNIVVVGSTSKVDALIAKLQKTTGMTETDKLTTTLGLREFHFKKDNDTFTFSHLSTKMDGDTFVYATLVNAKLQAATLCIACDKDDTSLISFLGIANKHSVGFLCILNPDEHDDIISEIKAAKSKGQSDANVSVPSKAISYAFIRKSSPIEQAADTAIANCRLFTKLAIQGTPNTPDTFESVVNNNNI